MKRIPAYVQWTHAAALMLTVVITAGAEIIDSVNIAEVWSGHPVSFCLLTHGDKQFVAYYDADRRMTVAVRSIDAKTWQFQELPEKVGWDSHNYIVMAVDDAGHIHLAGNMHTSPLVYFRTAKPLDITSFERIKTMIGNNEKKVTYPKFLRGPNGEFLFTYRDGSSGNGSQIFNIYDATTQRWSRFLDRPLFDGEDQRNAYFNGPRPGPDGYFHLAWVWRDTPDCSTNHDVGYARSKDLKSWESAAGVPIALPIRLDPATTVDPVPIESGLVNTSISVGFDDKGKAVVSYHKFDEGGHTQAYNARFEENAWRIVQVSDWKYRWNPRGGGSIPVEIWVGRVYVDRSGRLVQSFGHKVMGSGLWVLDPGTLKPMERLPLESPIPQHLHQCESDFPGVRPRFTTDLRDSNTPDSEYFLRWEALGPNRDKPRDPPLPEPSMLRVYRVR